MGGKKMITAFENSHIRHINLHMSFVCHAHSTPSLDSERGWTREICSKTNILKYLYSLTF